VIALPWIARSGIMAQLELRGSEPGQVYEALETRLSELVSTWLEAVDPELPVVLTAHASVQGASYGGERTVMLGGDLVLSGSLVRNPRLDYVALGHIHKPQDLNSDGYPPVIYPGSIERVDFGEARDDKFFVIAHIERRGTRVEWRQLTGIRPFFDCHLRLENQDAVSERLRRALPQPEQMEGAIVRLVLEYPREWEVLIDEAALREYTRDCLEFHLVKRPQVEARIRLPEDHTVGSLTPLELLDIYWAANHTDEEDRRELANLAGDVIHEVHNELGE
jgi:exonuclease SbcD